jgi:methionyl-tRNA formyltransferase
MIRRLCCVQSQGSTSTFTTTNKKKPVVLLGAPQVSTIVLDALLTASASPHSSFEVAAIVTQPPARRDRGKKLSLSPLANFALERGFSSHLIFTPQRAGDVIN